MKTLLALIIATAGFAAAAPSATAGGSHGHGHGHGYSHSCRPVYKLYTREVCRHYFSRTVHSCGRCYTVRYVKITYRNYYSNGSSTTFTRTLRA